MTKEEIQKNSEHWYNKYKDAEKQIADLKKENAELKQINSETLAQLNLDNGELIIENENLRKQLDALSGDIPWNKFKDVSEVTKQLTEAKKYIRELSRAVEHSYSVLSRQRPPIKAEAEQFLNSDGCPDVMCEDCTKEDCGVRQLGLVGKVK